MTERLTDEEQALRAILESVVQGQVQDALEKAGFLFDHRASMASRKSRARQPGIPDLVAVHPTTGRVLFIECKREKPSSGTGRDAEGFYPRQRRWQEALMRAHELDRVIYLVAKPSTMTLVCDTIAAAAINVPQRKALPPATRP